MRLHSMLAQKPRVLAMRDTENLIANLRQTLAEIVRRVEAIETEERRVSETSEVAKIVREAARRAAALKSTPREYDTRGFFQSLNEK